MAESIHFTNKELACPCCGTNAVSIDLLAKLETMRHLLGDRPILVNSGYRCKAHNKTLKNSKPTSAHLSGLAVDIDILSDRERGEIIETAIKLKIKGIGVYKGHVHLDIKPRRYLTIWHG